MGVRRSPMPTTPGKSYVNTTVDTELLKSLKILAIKKERRMNDLLEEAILDLLKKYEG